MAVQRTHKQSDLEKRLKLLDMQLYGKKDLPAGKTGKLDPASSIQLQNPASSIQRPASNQDVGYLRQDLLKISILAAAAFAIELGLYFSNIYSRIKFF